MTPAERQKEIAVAFAAYFTFARTTPANVSIMYDEWVKREEGNRLTAEDLAAVPEPAETALDALTQIAQSMVYLSEHQLVIKRQLDRIEGSMKFEPKE